MIYLFVFPAPTRHTPQGIVKRVQFLARELKDLFIKPNRQSLFTTKKLLVKNGREAKGC